MSVARHSSALQRGFFVTGTDTSAGKTVLAAALVAAARAKGIAVRPLKPVITGLDEDAPPEWPHDHELLAQAAACTADEVALAAYGPPASPHLAADLVNRPIDVRWLEDRVANAIAEADLAVVEGVGGLLVPLADGYDVRALARFLNLPLLIAARPGLGTINHTLLTLEAARAAQLEVAAVVLTPWPQAPGEIEHSNRETIAARGEVAVEVLRKVSEAKPDVLALAAESLPLDAWFGMAANGDSDRVPH